MISASSAAGPSRRPSEASASSAPVETGAGRESWGAEPAPMNRPGRIPLANDGSPARLPTPHPELPEGLHRAGLPRLGWTRGGGPGRRESQEAQPFRDLGTPEARLPGPGSETERETSSAPRAKLVTEAVVSYGRVLPDRGRRIDRQCQLGELATWSASPSTAESTLARLASISYRSASHDPAR